MKVTIGELINELMLYSRSIQMNMAGEFPFLRAEIGNNSKYTKAHIYIVQVSEHHYSICDYHDDLHGNRYVPTQNTSSPFIKEKELIHRMYDVKDHNDEKDSIALNLGYLNFLDHMYNLLFQYGVIKIDPRTFSKKILDHDIIPLSARVIKGLGTIFKDRRITDPKIKDLITIVKSPTDVFNIRGMKDRDIKEMQTKFQNIGINLVVEKNIIIDIHFEKNK